MIIMPVISGGVSKPAVSSYKFSSSTTTNATTYTFTSLTLNGSGTRVIALGVTAEGGSSAWVVSSITFGGSGMTIVQNQADNTGGVSETVTLAYIETALSTATIVVTYTGARQNCTLRGMQIDYYKTAAPVTSAIRDVGSPGTLACAGGSPTAGVLIAGARITSATYPTFSNGPTLTNGRVENSNTSSGVNFDATSTALTSSSPDRGRAIVATWK